MPRLERVVKRKAEAKRSRRAQAALKPLTNVSRAARTLADKKWATKDKTLLKKYRDDLATARNKRKSNRVRNTQQKAKQAALKVKIDKARAKKEAEEAQKQAEAKKDKEVSALRTSKRVEAAKQKKKPKQKKQAQAITTLFDEDPPTRRKSSRSKGKPRK